MPSFSIIIPTYHRNDLLRNCLAALAPSVQTIDASEYEVIVTDDGKTSTAETLVREEFPWARWVAGPQKGPAANRNSGAKQASGEWLVFTDDDCVPTPGFIAGYKEAVMATGARAYEGKTTCVEGIPSPLYISPINLTGGYFWSCNIMMQRDLFFEMDGFDENFAYASNEDADLRERLRHRGIEIVFAPNAAIDHPPRLRKHGAKAGKTHETFVQMWYMTGNRSGWKISLKMLVMIAIANIAWVRQHRFSKDTLVSLGYGITEELTVAAYLPKWISKYKKRFGNHAPEYNYPY